MSSHELYLGDLCLSGVDGEDFWFETLADGYGFGTPEATRVLVQSLLRDGDDVRVSRYGNRVVTLTVEARGPDSTVLAAAERALSLACSGRTTLTWTPPDGLGEPTVFDVLVAEYDHEFDDLAEVRSGNRGRRFSLRLECLPFARSVDPITETFTPTATAPTSVDACSSAAAWSAAPLVSGTATVAAETYLGETVIKVTGNTTSASQDVLVTWAGGVSMPTTEYVALDVAARSDMSLGQVRLLRASTYQFPVASLSVTLSGRAFTRYYFLNPYRVGGEAAVDVDAELLFRVGVLGAGEGVDYIFDVANLYSQNTLGATNTITLDVNGSVRSPASVRYWNNGGVSSMRTRFLCYADPILLDGFDPSVQDTWASAPDGTYVLYAVTPWAAVAGDVLAVTVTDAAGREQTVTTRLVAATANRALWPVGEVQLGGFDSGVAGVLTLSATVNEVAAAPASYRLFRKHADASLTYLDTSTDSAGVTSAISSRDFRIDAPTLARPRGGVFIDGVSAFHKADPWDFPMMVPPVTALYVEDDDATPLVTEATYYPRAHTFSAD